MFFNFYDPQNCLRKNKSGAHVIKSFVRLNGWDFLQIHLHLDFFKTDKEPSEKQKGRENHLYQTLELTLLLLRHKEKIVVSPPTGQEDRLSAGIPAAHPPSGVTITEE